MKGKEKFKWEYYVDGDTTSWIKEYRFYWGEKCEVTMGYPNEDIRWDVEYDVLELRGYFYNIDVRSVGC